MYKQLAVFLSLLFACLLYTACSDNPEIGGNGEDDDTSETLGLSQTEVIYHGTNFTEFTSVINVTDEIDCTNFEASVRYPEGETEEWLEIAVHPGWVYINPISACCGDVPRIAYIDVRVNKRKNTIKIEQTPPTDDDDMSVILGEGFTRYLLYKGFGHDGIITLADVKAITDLGNLRMYGNNNMVASWGIEDFSILGFFKNLKIAGDLRRGDDYLSFEPNQKIQATIDFSYVPKLESLYLHAYDHYDGASFNFKNLDALANIRTLTLMMDANVNTFDFSGLKNLEHFATGSIRLEELDISETHIGLNEENTDLPCLNITNEESNKDFIIWVNPQQLERYNSNKFRPWINLKDGHKAHVILKGSEYREPKLYAEIKYIKPWYVYSKLTIENNPNPPVNSDEFNVPCCVIYADANCREFVSSELGYNSSDDGLCLSSFTSGLKENTTYYLRWHVRNGETNPYTQNIYYSEILEFKTPAFVAPRYHIERVKVYEDNSVSIIDVADAEGNYSLNKKYYRVGKTPDFTLEESVGTSDNGTSIHNLEADTQYYAKVFYEFSGGERKLNIATEPYSFRTPPVPEPEIFISCPDHRYSRLSHDHIGNGVTKFVSSLKASAYYSPTDIPIEKFYFETDGGAVYNAVCTTKGCMEMDTEIVFYWNMSAQPKPHFKLRAVIEYKEKKYVSAWTDEHGM